MQQERIEGYILHTRKFGDTSLILDVLRADDIRESFICRGVFRPRSRFSGLLKPFTALSFETLRRRGMPLITEATLLSNAPFSDPKAMYCGIYLNELLTYLLKAHDAHEGIYQRYHEAIESLKRDTAIEPTLRCFERDLLSLLGYGLELEYDSETGETIQPDSWYDYRLELGPIRCSQSMSSQERVGYRVSGATLQALARGSLKASQERFEAKGLLRYVMNFHLEGRRLRSRDLFRCG